MSIITELHNIYEKGGQILRAEDVVEFARDPKTELHKNFTWDDNEAAHQWRLEQARNVIQVHVLMSPSTQKTVRAFVSLASDRRTPGGGYRRIEDVLANPEQRAELLKQALREANRWREKYKVLQELAPIFDAMEEAAQSPLLVEIPEEALNLVA